MRKRTKKWQESVWRGRKSRIDRVAAIATGCETQWTIHRSTQERNLLNNTQEHTIALYNEWQYTKSRCNCICEQWNPVYNTEVKAGLWVTIHRGTPLYMWVTIHRGRQNCTSCTDVQGNRNDDDELIMTSVVTLVMMISYWEFLRSAQVARKSSRGHIYTFAS